MLLGHAKLDFTIGLTLILAAVLSIPSVGQSAEGSTRICDGKAVYKSRRLAGSEEDNLCATYRGKVLLVVNTASRCAFTDQYEGLEKLYAEYRDRGLVVIGFPSNDFGNQEPGSEKSIKSFCRLTYGVRFPMYAKTKVKGVNADPFYQALSRAAGQSPGWNFHKYLIDRDGKLTGSYSSSTEPRSETLIQAIERLL